MDKLNRSSRATNWLLLLVTLGLVFLISCVGIPDSADHGTPTSAANRTEESLPIRGVQEEIDLSNYVKIPLSAEQIQVNSTFKSYGKENLITESGFWHVKVPREGLYSWVMVTLDRKRPIALLRVLPWTGHGDVMWRGHAASLEASNDAQNWTTLATLGIIPWPPDDDWINFLVLTSQPYRYYRISVGDPNFLAIAGLELYQLVGYGPSLPKAATTPAPALIPTFTPLLPIPSAPLVAGTSNLNISGLKKLTIEANQIQVSSIHRTGMGGEQLVQPGRDNFWHVKAPREENPAWVTISLDVPVSVAAIRILSRTGQTAQLWAGGTAILEGSRDASDWIPLSTLFLNKSELRDDWIGFPLGNTDPFQFYRISIYDPQFFSIARLEIYTSQ